MGFRRNHPLEVSGRRTNQVRGLEPEQGGDQKRSRVARLKWTPASSWTGMDDTAVRVPGSHPEQSQPIPCRAGEVTDQPTTRAASSSNDEGKENGSGENRFPPNPPLRVEGQASGPRAQRTRAANRMRPGETNHMGQCAQLVVLPGSGDAPGPID